MAYSCLPLYRYMQFIRVRESSYVYDEKSIDSSTNSNAATCSSPKSQSSNSLQDVQQNPFQFEDSFSPFPIERCCSIIPYPCGNKNRTRAPLNPFKFTTCSFWSDLLKDPADLESPRSCQHFFFDHTFAIHAPFGLPFGPPLDAFAVCALICA